nr:hypothetical protein [Tanacetum cinerariifolium]
MDDPNITIEEYIMLEEEKAHRHVFIDNLKTDSEKDNDKFNMPSFPSPEPEVKMDDPNITIEEYIMLEEEKARRHVSIDNLKTDSEKDNDKFNMPSFPSPEPKEPYGVS